MKIGISYAARASACSNIAVTPAITRRRPSLMADISCALSNCAERMKFLSERLSARCTIAASLLISSALLITFYQPLSSYCKECMS